MQLVALYKMRSKEKDRAKAIKLLERDLKNGPFHCFGVHDNCSPDFCTNTSGQSTTSDNTSSHSDNGTHDDSDQDDHSLEDDISCKLYIIVYLHKKENKICK